MRADELMIGNYYIDIDDNLTELSGYELYQMTIKENTNNLGVNEYRPILLTEEWLLNSGLFEINKEYDTFHIGKFAVSVSDDGCIFFHVDCYDKFEELAEFEYIHELQNLLSALNLN